MKGAPRQDVLLKYLLVNDQGTLNPGRHAAYKKAIQEFAKNKPEQWGDFVNSLGTVEKQ
jgi:hypothetical protein